MADDDAPGGSPACFLDEVDPAYAGYLTESEVDGFLTALLARERAVLAGGAAEGAGTEPLAQLVAALEGEVARRDIAHRDSGKTRFAPPSDSMAVPAGGAALEAEVIAMLEATLPRIAGNVLHDALNQALDAHRRRQATHPAG